MPAKKPARKPVKKMPPRVSILAEDKLTPAQRALLDSIRSGPRGGSTTIRGPFAVFLHAPAFGELAQQLGGHCRFKTSVPPRLSELYKSLRSLTPGTRTLSSSWVRSFCTTGIAQGRLRNGEK